MNIEGAIGQGSFEERNGRRLSLWRGHDGGGADDGQCSYVPEQAGKWNMAMNWYLGVNWNMSMFWKVAMFWKVRM